MSPAISIEEAIRSVPDGATIALGGVRLQRRPMAFVRALVAAGRRDLTVVAFLGSLDVELLLSADCVRELHAPAVGLDAAGLAPAYRAARQNGSVRFVEWSEGLLLTSLEAAARGVPSHPAWMGLGSDLPDVNPWLRPGNDPFDGSPIMHVRALAIDLALLHAAEADSEGNLYVSGDLAADGLMARAARRTLATYERDRERDPGRVAISRLWVDAVCHSPRGAWPTGCHPHYLADLDVARRWAAGDGDPGILAA